MKSKMLLSWSSGKDSAWALYRLSADPDIEIVGLVTSFNEAFDRVAMHSVRRELVEKQADALGLPIWPVMLPWPCSNQEYEERFAAVIDRACTMGISQFAFGDLFLEDVRAYRERQLAGTGMVPIFPLWGSASDTPRLANEMIAGGLQAILTCIDLKQLSREFAGRMFDATLLSDLPPQVDACGERGEFHTFCFAGPMFPHRLPVAVGEQVERSDFVFADLISA